MTCHWLQLRFLGLIYKWWGNFNFADRAYVRHSVSAVSTVSADTGGSVGKVYEDARQQAYKVNSSWTSATQNAPDGGVYIGNTGVDYEINSVRIYDRALTADEVAFNAAIDKIRYDGADPATVIWPSGYRYNAEDKVIEVETVVSAADGVEVSADDGETWVTSVRGWYARGAELTVKVRSPEGAHVYLLSTSAVFSGDGTSLTVTADTAEPVVVKAGATITWQNNADNVTKYWDDETMWKDEFGTSRLPEAYDTVVIPNRSGTPYHNHIIAVTNLLPRFRSVYVGSKRTLRLGGGWSNKLEADRVVVWGETRNDSIASYAAGVISCAGGFTDATMSNRVWIVADELVLSNAYAKISADSGGYGVKNGPAWGGVTPATSACAPHGGASSTGQGAVYGSITEPTEPGSGAGGSANFSPSGGGAIRIEATNIVINGSISCTGGTSSYGWGGGSGSGGSVFISCRTVSGTGSVSANGGGNTSTKSTGSGGGGRISVVYDSAPQAAVDCRVAFAARGGCELASANTRYNVGYSGTLYFTDDRFLRRPGRMLAGWVYYGPDVTLANSLVGENLSLTNSLVELTTGAVVNVTGNLSFEGTNTRVNGLRISDGDVPINVGGGLTLTGARLQVMKGSTITVGGDLVVNDGTTLNNCGEMYVRSAATNGTEASGYATSITVGGHWRIGRNALASILCDPATGAIIPLSSGAFTVAEGGTLSANAGGWTNTKAPGYCNGYGGSHGGLGAAENGGYPKKKDGTLNDQYLYGNKKRPLLPGSSGNGNGSYLAGGGVIWLNTHGTMDVCGTISANGSNNGGWTSAGSGGSVYLQCGKIAGSTSGAITANGGSSTTSFGRGPGGGGRIALRYRASAFGDVNPTNVIKFSVDGGIGLEKVTDESIRNGLPGSIYVRPVYGLKIFVR